MSGSHKHFGKYRGTVTNNIDPMQTGRVQVMVPDLATYQPTTWALPCVPLAGMQSGIFVVPVIGASVWVEFEQGNLDFPIWVGGYWQTTADVPLGGANTAPTSPPIVIQTRFQHRILISDTEDGTGAIVLQSPGGASLRIGRAGITLSNGQGATIKMAGPTVDINNGALVVT